MGLEVPFWRAIAVFRIASLIYAALLIVRNNGDYAHPVGGWAVLAVMAIWTAAATYGYARPPRPSGWVRALPPLRSLRVRNLAIVDLLVAVGCLLATRWVETPERIEAGARTLSAIWVASAVLAWAVSGGKRHGAVAAALLSLAELAIHAGPGVGFELSSSGFNSVVLLFFVGVIVGHVAELAADAQRRTVQALEMEAAQRERERLARSIHDSVLQVLALVQRRGAELGGEAAELGRLAGEQEIALRALVGTGGTGAATVAITGRAATAASTGGAASDPPADAYGVLDLRDLLAPHASASVTIAAPATPVRVPAAVAREVTAAVGAALDNVRRHCGDGARAWVLVEDEGSALTVSVRDEGPGIPHGRLEQAVADGRLGVAQSIKGRLRDLGGTTLITSVPGEGTEIELRVPLR